MMSCTPALQRLHLPSKRIMGRESVGWKMEGMEKRGRVEEVDFLEVVCCCFLMLRPKRVKVGSVADDGGGEAMDAADRHDDDVDLLAVLDIGGAKASADERRKERHVATATATFMMPIFRL